MKTTRPIVTFLLGITAGACVFSLARFRLPSRGGGANSREQVVDNRPSPALSASLVKQSVPRRAKVRARRHSSRHFRAMSSVAARVRLPARPRARKVKAHEFVWAGTSAPEKVMVEKAVLPPPGSSNSSAGHTAFAASLRFASVAPPAVSASSLAQAARVLPTPPAPTLFRAIGYVEKATGQAEAVIMQEGEIHVVHFGDRIADRYRVTSITQDVVGAIDETTPQVAMANPGGIVKSDGSDIFGGTLADVPGQGPRLRPATYASLSEAPTASSPSQLRAVSSAKSEEFRGSSRDVEPAGKSLGYIEQSDGQVEAVFADEESIRLVPETQSETMALPIPPGDHGEGVHAVSTPAAQGVTAPAILARSALSYSAIHSGQSLGGAKFSPVAYQNSTPFVGGETPAK